MSIASEISRIQQAKADIKTAIEAKGVTVPSSATIDAYDDYVTQISGGGGSSADTQALKGMIDRSITSVEIPSGVTSIGDSAFRDCSSLTGVTIPSGVTSIGGEAFRGCGGLTSIDIPDSVTSIGNQAFYNCRSLTSLTIPSGVTSIGNQAFYNCTSVGSMTILATTPPTLSNANAFNGTTWPIYVPSESVDAYKAAGKWSSLASRIQAIPNS